MNWRTTWILVAVAVALFAYIVVLERHLTPTMEGPQPAAALLEFKPEEVTGIQVRRGTELLVRAELTNESWQISFPVNYPAQAFAVAGLLQEIGKLNRGTFLRPEELKQGGQSVDAFQLDIPAATLTLQAGERRLELKFGSKTPVGDRVYAQVQDSANIFVVDADVLNRVPRTPDEWRDTALLDLRKVAWNRMEFRSEVRKYAVELDPTNRTFILTQPTPARADTPKIVAMLGDIQNARVLEFVEDDPGAELGAYGLESPRAEILFGRGTNVLASLKFGASPTNDLDSVYVLRSERTNVVRGPAGLLRTLMVSHAELREKRLLTVLPETVDRIELGGRTNLVLQRMGDTGWTQLQPVEMPADPELVGTLFAGLDNMEGEVERDVVTDLTGYGLAPPALQYRLYDTQTNAAGVVTNVLLGGLDFGTGQEGRVYVRRTDEQTVYSVAQTDFDTLPKESWQLRYRRLWTFATNQVTRVTVQAGDGKAEILRTGPAEWELAPGSQGILNDLALEETVHRLGLLEADFWVARGQAQASQLGFDHPQFSLTFELSNPGGDPIRHKVEFSQAQPNRFPQAMSVVDGAPVVFEFPKKLYFEIIRDLIKPLVKESDLPQ